MGSCPPPLRWIDPPDGPAVELLDQTRLPAAEEVVSCSDVAELADAIGRLVVRGAPLLGIAGAYGVALAAFRGDDVAAEAERLVAARPTAVNLAWGVRRALAAYRRAVAAPAEGTVGEVGAFAALEQARRIAADDAAASAAIAAHGLELVPPAARILTHCNTGALVSGGDGTAFAVVAAAHRVARLAKLWIDETRPLLQGSRLTAYEARRAEMPHAVLADAAAASLMAAGMVDLVVIGADRIAADGSVANKVGSLGLAVLARHYGIPFVVAAPVSTIDLGTPDGAAIPVEQRPESEVTAVGGRPVAPAGTTAYNPAFDVTPPDLVTALVTEGGIVRPVTAGNLRVLRGSVSAGVTAAAYVAR